MLQSSAAEMTFATLKAPEPSLLAPPSGGGPAMGVPVASGAAAHVTAPQTAAPRRQVLPDEYMRGGGCFAPEGIVTRLEPASAAASSSSSSSAAAAAVAAASSSSAGAASGAAAYTRSTPIRLDAVRAGDVLATADGGAARVRCVVATECEGGRALLVQLPGGGPTLTPWHPVRDNNNSSNAAAGGRWRFPLMIAGGTQAVRACPYVLNLVLDRCHELLVDGVACVTLGHGLQGDAVVEHAYWGTAAVVADLSRFPGWQRGFVLLRPKELGGAAAAAAAPAAEGAANAAAVEVEA